MATARAKNLSPRYGLEEFEEMAEVLATITDAVKRGELAGTSVEARDMQRMVARLAFAAAELNLAMFPTVESKYTAEEIAKLEKQGG